MKVAMKYEIQNETREETLVGEKCGYSIEPPMSEHGTGSWNRIVRIWNNHESVTIAFRKLISVRLIEDSGSSND